MTRERQLADGSIADVDTLHLDGLSVGWRQMPDGSKTTLVVNEYRDGRFVQEHMAITVTGDSRQLVQLQRIESLLLALCGYFNTGGTFDEFDAISLQIHEFIDTVRFPSDVHIMAIDEDVSRTLYVRHAGRILKVIPGCVTIPVSEQDMLKDLS